MSQKVVILSQFMYPERNSTGELLSSLAAGLVSAGFEVTAYCAQPSYFGTSTTVAPSLEWQGVQIRRVWSTRFGRRRRLGRIVDGITFIAGMLTVLPRLPRDAVVLVVSNPPTLPVIGALAKMIARTPLVVLIHDVYPEIAIQLGAVRTGGSVHRVLALLDRFVMRHADVFLVLGRDMRKRLEAKLPAGTSQRVHVIPNWADSGIEPMDKSESRIGRGEALADSFVVQYSGNVGLSQGLDVVVDAAEMLRNDKVIFTIVGEGLRLSHIRQEVRARQLTNVLFLPRIDWSNLSDSLAACDAAIVPLQAGTEGLSVPSKYYSILASGRPVLAVMDAGAEVALSVRENDCGAVIPAGDAARLADKIRDWKLHPKRVREQGRNARLAYERLYTRQQAVNEYVGVLAPLARTRKAATGSTPRLIEALGSPSVAPWLGPSLIAAAAWVLTATQSKVLIVLIGALLLPMLLLRPATRLPFVVIGGLTILSSSHSLSVAKIFYLAGVSIAMAGALMRIRSQASSLAYSRLRPVLITSAIWFVVICLSAVVAFRHGNAMVDWLRDSAPYLLLCAVPFLVFDASVARPERVTSLFLITGGAAALSFTVFIVSRRIVFPLPIDHIVLPSALLPAAVYCLATSQAVLESRNRLAWAAVSLTLLACFLATGSRTYLVLLATPLVVVLVSPQARRHVLRWLAIAAGITVVLVLISHWIFGLSGLTNPVAMDRLWQLPQFLAHPTADVSFRERLAEIRDAWDAFISQPLIGVGPGHFFLWRLPNGAPVRTFTLDTTLSYLAKFGLVGVAALVAVAWAWSSWIRHVNSNGRSAVMRGALISYLVVIISLFPLAAPLEDKGMSFGLMFLMVLALGQREASPVPAETVKAVRRPVSTRLAQWIAAR